jgi:hypothetical protein
MEQAKYFLEIPFSGAHPFVAEIFDFHYGNAGFAREALDEKGFPGSDRSANQVTHGQGLQLGLSPESNIMG